MTENKPEIRQRALDDLPLDAAVEVGEPVEAEHDLDVLSFMEDEDD